MHVGFVGTGNMGLPMALNLQKAGHRLSVWDLRPDATVDLERAGATRAAGLRALAEEVRVCFTSLPNESIVERVVVEMLDGARAGDVIIDLSTVSPGSTRRLAERARPRGVRLVDAPVSGSVAGARAGTLAVMVGAPAREMAPWEPLLKAIGSNVFYLDEVGRGNVLKLLNNLVALTNQAVLCEAIALADRLGVPRQMLGEVVGKSSGGSFILERKLAALVRHDYSPGFFVDLAYKDLGLAIDLAAEAGARVEVGRHARLLYEEARRAGFGTLDSSGLLALLEPRPNA